MDLYLGVTGDWIIFKPKNLIEFSEKFLELPILVVQIIVRYIVSTLT